MRVVFMGTPALAATVLRELAGHHEVIAAYTRPDAVRGRGRALVASDVKSLACELGIPVFTPTSLRDEHEVQQLRELEPELVCVSAYGLILPGDILEIPKHGCLNVHTSLLPRWRGAAPIERAILAGDSETGVCIMRMEQGLDTGPYCVRKTVPIAGRASLELTDALAHAGAEALVEAIGLVESGRVVWTEQSEDGVTYAEKIGKSELYPSADDTARLFTAKVRASSPAHPARAKIANRSLAIEDARVPDDDARKLCDDLEPGQVRLRAKRLFAGTSDGPVEILRVHPDGKRSMEAKAFAGGIQSIKTADIRLERL